MEKGERKGEPCNKRDRVGRRDAGNVRKNQKERERERDKAEGR